MTDIVLVPNYPGPSPACKQKTVNGVQIGLDVYLNKAAFSIDTVLWERNADGSYSYINQNKGLGLLVSLMIRQHPLYTAVEAYEYPGGKMIAGTPDYIVTTEGEDGMVFEWGPKIEAVVNARCAPGADPTDPRSPEEVAAQQTIAWGVYDTTISDGFPVTVAHVPQPHGP